MTRNLSAVSAWLHNRAACHKPSESTAESGAEKIPLWAAAKRVATNLMTANRTRGFIRSDWTTARMQLRRNCTQKSFEIPAGSQNEYVYSASPAV